MTGTALDTIMGGPRTPVIRQDEAAECGIACLAMVAGHHGFQIDLATLRRRYPISLKGATLATLMRVADALGFNTRGLRCEIEELRNVPLPAILHMDMSHFAVLVSTTIRRGKRVWVVHDPAAGALTLSNEELSRRFTGVVLELIPSERFTRRNEATRLKLPQLWSRIDGLKPALVRIGLLSVALQVVALALPFHMQTAIDSVLPASDRGLLIALAIGFGGLITIQFATSWLRGRLLADLGVQLGYQLVVNLFRQLMRLPYAWFERRHVGDILSRFTSTEPLVGMLTQGMLAAVVDGLLAMAALVLMLLYSPTLTLIALGALLLSGLLKLAYLQALKVLNVNLITAMAQEQSALVESIRGILSVKTFGQEDTRQRLWQNRLAEAVNAKLRMAQTTAGFDAAQNAILGFETIAFTFVAIGLVMDAQFTVGMLFAFQSFKMHFLGAGTRLIQTAVDWRLNGVHLNRIADIALSEPERGLLGAGVDQPMLTGRIELRNIGWRYGTGEPLVLQQVNLTIEPGETVLLIGPSGGGKTTLMKIMLGLLDPTIGEVLVDGIPLQSYGKAGFRRQIGAIMQDDLLYAGTIAENIAFFDSRIDMDQVREAARKASIDADIQQMPMGYETLVGDMGSSLSGGQRQRVMIARALYRQPRIVFADEITASLDPASHERVGEAIASLEATRIIVTHRAFMALPKARVFLVDGGTLREVHLNQEVQ